MSRLSSPSESKPSTLSVRRVVQIEDFHALAPIWSKLTQESGSSSPFLSHDWFDCCWRAVQPECQPEVLVFEEDRTPLAVVPLMRQKKMRRGFPIRALGLLECPDTPFGDFIVAGEHERVIDAFLRHLRGRSDWDLLSLDNVPHGSPTPKWLEAASAGRNSFSRSSGAPSPYLEISGSWNAFLSGRSQRFRKTCRNIQNRIERLGTVSVEEHRSIDPDSPLFSEILEVSRQSWKAEQGVALATMPKMPAFFRELTRRASNNGWLRVFILRLNGHAVATEYQVQSEGRAHALRADFAYGMRELSPGAYLNFRIAQTLFEEGTVHQYDMGPGANDYKLRWASASHETLRLEAYRESLYAKLIHAIEDQAVPVLRRWRDQWGRGPVKVADEGSGS